MAQYIRALWFQTTVCNKNVKLLQGPHRLRRHQALCTPIAKVPRDEATKDEIEPEEVIGLVYLMKFGRHYKIGRSNSAGRREYELATQMPEKLITVHTIRTDDPAGIEDYWTDDFQTNAKMENGST
jgi:hypothetical protein